MVSGSVLRNAADSFTVYPLRATRLRRVNSKNIKQIVNRFPLRRIRERINNSNNNARRNRLADCCREKFRYETLESTQNVFRVKNTNGRLISTRVNPGTIFLFSNTLRRIRVFKRTRQSQKYDVLVTSVTTIRVYIYIFACIMDLAHNSRCLCLTCKVSALVFTLLSRFTLKTAKNIFPNFRTFYRTGG